LKIVLILISFCISMLSACGATIPDVNNVSFHGDPTLMGTKIERVYAQDGAFLIVTTGARYEYVPGELKMYQGLGNNKRLLSTIIFDENTPLEKVADNNDRVLFWSDKFNIGIYSDSTCIIGAKQSCNITFKSNFEPTFCKISNEISVLSDILGGLCISPQLNGNGFSVREQNKDLLIKAANQQAVIVRMFSNISDKTLLLSNAKNPQAVKEIADRKRTVANAAWWGFDKTDSTYALQSAISSGAEQVFVPYMGTDWIVEPIKLASNQEIIFGTGVVVCAKKGEFKGQNASLFNVDKKTNIKIRGYGATFRMQKEDYTKPGYPKGESRMAISIFDSSNIEITGLNLSDSGGDGIFIGTDARSYYGYCENIAVKDCMCDNNYRQGISITSAKNVLIDNCIFQNTNGTAPSAGIDLEPSNDTHKLTNIVISNCISQFNAGAGFALYLKHLTSKTEDISVLFTNCLVKKCGKSGLIVGAVNDDGPGGIVEFRNCTITDLREPGAYIFDKSPKSAKLRFTDCKWSNVASDKKTSYQNYTLNSSPIHFLVREPELANSIGGVDFINCSVYDNNDRPVMKILNRGRDIQDIRGLINVYTEYEARVEPDSKESKVEVILKKQPIQ
jgi:parallel beta-helix repeat protein